MPSNAYDAKGMLIASVEDGNPVIYIDDRELYSMECDVPEGYFKVSLDKAHIDKVGKNVTIVSSSYMLYQVKIATDILKKKNIDAEVIDLRSIKPIDTETILNSVRKTGHLVVVDGGWITGGVCSEIITLVAVNAFESLKSAPLRIALPDTPAPASYVLENAYYPDYNKIVDTILTFNF
jgi:pyruvate dehydrogenase E1 component beta subunit